MLMFKKGAWYGGRRVTADGVEVPEHEADAFKRYGWEEVKPKKASKKASKKAKGEAE